MGCCRPEWGGRTFGSQEIHALFSYAKAGHLAHQQKPHFGVAELASRANRSSVTLIGNSDSCDVPPENKAAIFEDLFNTQTKGFFRLSALRHCVQQVGSPLLTSACSRLLFSVTYTLNMVGNCIAFSGCAVGARTHLVAAQIRRNHYGY